MQKALGACLVLLALLLVSCGKSEEEECCECIVEQGCWDSRLCPEDPVGSCKWVRADGDLPSYADEGSDVCFAFGASCANEKCGCQ